MNRTVWPLSLLTPAPVTGAAKTTLQLLILALDVAVSDSLTSLGVSLYEVDVWVNGVRCDDVAPVN